MFIQTYLILSNLDSNSINVFVNVPYIDSLMHQIIGADCLPWWSLSQVLVTNYSAVCECMCVPHCQVYGIAANLSNWATVFHQLSPLITSRCQTTGDLFLSKAVIVPLKHLILERGR